MGGKLENRMGMMQGESCSDIHTTPYQHRCTKSACRDKCDYIRKNGWLKNNQDYENRGHMIVHGKFSKKR